MLPKSPFGVLSPCAYIYTFPFSCSESNVIAVLPIHLEPAKYIPIFFFAVAALKSKLEVVP